MKIYETSDIGLIQRLASLCYMEAYKKIHTVEQNRFSFNEMYATESLEKQLERGQFFVLEDEGEARGYMAVYRISEQQWMLDKLYILPECKGRGYGRALVDHIIAIIRRRYGCPVELLLDVNRRNEAVAFYQHLGFEITDSWDRVIADGQWLMDGYRMRLTLQA